jgi:hypothetical protein
MSRLPLKYKSGNDVQEITTAEHNYLAYLAGLELETVSGTYSEAVLGSLGKTNQSNDLNVGSFTNTEYTGSNGDVGDHGTLTITTTTTPIYQQDASVSLHADFRNPLYQKQTSGQQEIQEFNSTDQTDLGETLAGIIYTNDYPGTFKLGSSAPSGDYSVAIANVMTDTRTTGADIVYNIYQRHTMTAPTEIDLMAVARGSSSPYNASTGTYRGLIIMADAQRKETAKGCLDSYLATITSTNLPIGSYVIRSSSQGTPSETGTWVAKGTAIDTRNAIADANYTNTFQDGAFTKTISSNFSGTYTGTYTGTGTVTYDNISSSNRWERVSTQTPAVGDGVEVYVGGSLVASSVNANATTITAGNGVVYNRGDLDSIQSITGSIGNRTTTSWYEFSAVTSTNYTGTYTGFYGGTKTTTSTPAASTGTFVGDTIQNTTENIETYTLYVRTA